MKSSGALVGLGCGDALGRPVEFNSPDQISRKHGRVTELLGNGTHGQPAGTITDDTELALCIGRSLNKEGEFHPQAVVDEFVEWYESDPFDIGGLTASTLRRHAAGGDWRSIGIEDWKHLPEGRNAGNGSLMRCAPYGLAFHSTPESLIVASRVSSALTHADPRCQWSCVILNTTIAGLLHEVDLPLAEALDLAEDAPNEVREAAATVANVVAEDNDSETIALQNSGYVVTTLQAGLYHGLTAETAEEAIVDAVMMGGDTDTLAAVTGAVAGARFGCQALPERWTTKIDAVSELKTVGRRLTNANIGVSSATQQFFDSNQLEIGL